MATTSFYMTIPIFKIRFFLFLCFFGIGSSQLSSDFYSTTCPNALSTIKSVVDSAVSNEARMGASLLRLHFHDCFVQASQLTLSSIFFKFLLFQIYTRAHACTCMFITNNTQKNFLNKVAVLLAYLVFFR